MRLVLDIDRSADGRVEGFVHPVGAQAPMPFSGLLELLGALEELLFPDEGRQGPTKPQGEKIVPATRRRRSLEVPSP